MSLPANYGTTPLIQILILPSILGRSGSGLYEKHPLKKSGYSN